MRGTGPHPHPLSSRVATATRTMALNPRSPSKHNQMITRFIKQSKPTKLDDVKEPPTKKQKLNDSPSTRRSPRKATKYTNHEIPDSDAEDGDLPIEVANEPHKTDLESALPPVKSDEEAIEEYAAFKASQEETKEETEERLKDRNWVRGKSSIYVDAFNLALDTVLDEESHLFDEAEMEVFKVWKALDYEAQYLYEPYTTAQ
jgi:Fanconi-associated nuclease 1